MIIVGIDAGAATTKALVIKEKEIAGYTISGKNPSDVKPYPEFGPSVVHMS